MPSVSTVNIWNRALSRIGETKQIQDLQEDSPSRRICELHYEDVLKEMLEQRDWPWATKQAPLVSIDDVVEITSAPGGNAVFGINSSFVDPSTVKVELNNVLQVIVTDYSIVLPKPGQNGSIVFVVTPAVSVLVKITVSTKRVGWDFIYALPADYVSSIGLLTSETRFDNTPADHRGQFEVMLNNSSDGYILCTNLKAKDIDAFEYTSMVDGEYLMPRHFVNALVWRLAMELALSIKKDPKLHNFFDQKFQDALSTSSAYSQNEGHSGPEPLSPSLSARG